MIKKRSLRVNAKLDQHLAQACDMLRMSVFGNNLIQRRTSVGFARSKDVCFFFSTL